MLHLRLIVPPDRSADVRAALAAEAGVTHLVVLAGVAHQPVGDVLLCDVTRQAADHVLDRLRRLGVEEHGAITVETADATLSRSADAAKKTATGHGADAVVWDEVTSVTKEESTHNGVYLALLTFATMVAACGVMLDSPILVVASQVVGPDFWPLAGVCLGLVRRQVDVVRRSLVTLLVGFPVAMALTMGFTWLMHGIGLFQVAQLDAPRPLTAFIYAPDGLAFVLALIGGAAGVLSLTSGKSGALIGVLISVTTVPAAGNTAVALAYGRFTQASGSAVQLAVNLSGIVLAGLLTLVVLKIRQRWRADRRATHPRESPNPAAATA